MLRRSITNGRRRRRLTRVRSRARKAFHSVTRINASAPSIASYGSVQYSSSGISFFASAIPSGSKARTVAPAWDKAGRNARLGLSRMSSVFGLKVTERRQGQARDAAAAGRDDPLGHAALARLAGDILNNGADRLAAYLISSAVSIAVKTTGV